MKADEPGTQNLQRFCLPHSALRTLRLSPLIVRRLLCGLVRAYQLFVSPCLPRTCRFYPSCSEYMIQAITRHGVLRGVAMGCWRLLRCNPFCPGGYDPVAPLSAHRVSLTAGTCGGPEWSESQTAAGGKQ